MIRLTRQLAIDTLHGTNRHTILDNRIGVDSISQAVNLDTRIVAHVHTSINRHTETKARTPRETQQVMESLGTSRSRQTRIHLR